MSYSADNLSLFNSIKKKKPLAEEIRPTILEDIYGQEDILSEDSEIKNMLSNGELHNMILWGPPGTGKTTIARIIVSRSKDKYHAERLSAVINNTQEIKEIFKRAVNRREQGLGTILLIDEIHRFNRAQQDIFLPYMEDGTIVLIGATTENPSFELNGALLSRSTVYKLNRLDEKALRKIIDRVEKIYNKTLPLTEEAKTSLCKLSDGDGRYLLNICEGLLAISTSDHRKLTSEELGKYIQKKLFNYDKTRDNHYNLISALHKAVRGSDVDASIYWLKRMLEGGEDRRYILRRLARMAVEDIGLADPNAIQQVLAAREMYDFIGSPEGDLAIIQALIYLAAAPKSNAVYMAEKKAKMLVDKYGSVMPPYNILNAPTSFMREQGYGKGYIYDHDVEGGYSGQNYWPIEIVRDRQNQSANAHKAQEITLYTPTNKGYEEVITKRLSKLKCR